MTIPDDPDPHLWLEEVEGDKALDWVRAENHRTIEALASDAEFKRIEAQYREVLDSVARIPAVQKLGTYYYNFWQDKQSPRGLWRRTTLEEYRKPAPAWETVLDIDALNRREKAQWVWKGAQCLRPDYTRCIVTLSPGGSDASVLREFDLGTKEFVPSGFEVPLGKGGVSWVDRDTLLVYTDFGAGTLTSSGYPRQVKRWTRGTPLAAAKLVYEGQANDVYIGAVHDTTPGFARSFVTRAVTFYTDELLQVMPDGALRRVAVPDSVKKTVHREWLLLQLREDWSVGSRVHKAGSLLVANHDAWMRGDLSLEVLFEPSASTALSEVIVTRGHVLAELLEDVKSRVVVWTPPSATAGASAAGAWQRRPMQGLPSFGNVNVAAVDAVDSDALWVTVTDFLTPSTLALAPEPFATHERLKAMPAFFDAGAMQVDQHFATSRDGTRVPYFLVRPKARALDGTMPTLLYGYGGFEVSQLPWYSGGIGRTWLERGGAFVVANIRGGGEYGPAWHQAALKAKRPRAYEDFAAVADDLVTRKVTSAKRLAAFGGSNGGLLTGNMLVGYPERFAALSIEVPLLDMRRYHKLLAGASWMAEYGDPDKPEEWAFIRGFSPYQLFDATRKVPAALITTSTKDDRVHPGHARKMVAKLRAAGKEAWYYENIEGGHGGAADNAQLAFKSALRARYLWDVLSR